MFTVDGFTEVVVLCGDSVPSSFGIHLDAKSLKKLKILFHASEFSVCGSLELKDFPVTGEELTTIAIVVNRIIA